MSADNHGPSRCAECLWALYDGKLCQNMICLQFGRNAPSVRMSNADAEAELRKRGRLPPRPCVQCSDWIAATDPARITASGPVCVACSGGFSDSTS